MDGISKKFSEEKIEEIVERVKDCRVSYIRAEERTRGVGETSSMFLTCFVDEDNRTFEVIKTGVESLIMIIERIREKGSKCELLNYEVKSNTLIADSLLYVIDKKDNKSQMFEMDTTIEKGRGNLEVFRKLLEKDAVLEFNIKGEKVEADIRSLNFSSSSFNCYVPVRLENEWVSVKLLWFMNELYAEDNLTVYSWDIIEGIEHLTEEEGRTKEGLYKYEINLKKELYKMCLGLDELSIVYSHKYLEHLLKLREGYQVYLTGIKEGRKYAKRILGEEEEKETTASGSYSRREVSDINLGVKFNNKGRIKNLLDRIEEDEEMEELVSKLQETEGDSREILYRIFYGVRDRMNETPTGIIHSKGFVDGVRHLTDEGFNEAEWHRMFNIAREELIKITLNIEEIKIALITYRYDLEDMYDRNEIIDYEYGYETIIERKGFEK